MVHRFSKRFAQSLKPLAAVAALVGVPLAAQAQTTQLWIDLSTSTMAGMPEFMQGGGGVGAVIGGLFGGKGGGGSQVYGHASGRFIQQGSNPGLSGAFPPSRVIDVALYNPRKPGTEVALYIPVTMGMGEFLPLVPPSPSYKETGDTPTEMPDIKGRILIYWGCGENVRPGQPKVINLSNNPAIWAGALAGRMAPERAARVGAQHALYPNEKNTVNPKSDTSLQGAHQVRGEGVPESMQFTLAERQDLMPSIDLSQQGDTTQSIQLSWQPVPRALAYHLHAMGMAGQDMVLWSSASNGDAGLGLFDYLTEGTAAKWVKDKVLLSPDTTQCAVPKGIFAGGQADGKQEAGGAMLRMIAYGPESYFSHPVRPPKAPSNWQPEWSVRVRTKSQTMAMLGIDMAGMATGRSAPQEEEKEKPSGLPGAAGAIFKGLFGR